MLLIGAFLFIVSLLAVGLYQLNNWYTRVRPLPAASSTVSSEQTDETLTSDLILTEPVDGSVSSTQETVIGGRSLPEQKLLILGRGSLQSAVSTKRGIFRATVALAPGANRLAAAVFPAAHPARLRSAIQFYLPDISLKNGEEIWLGQIRSSDPINLRLTAYTGPNRGKIVTVAADSEMRLLAEPSQRAAHLSLDKLTMEEMMIIVGRATAPGQFTARLLMRTPLNEVTLQHVSQITPNLVLKQRGGFDRVSPEVVADLAVATFDRLSGSLDPAELTSAVIGQDALIRGTWPMGGPTITWEQLILVIPHPPAPTTALPSLPAGEDVDN